jgi:hypothetical protein
VARHHDELATGAAEITILIAADITIALPQLDVNLDKGLVDKTANL